MKQVSDIQKQLYESDGRSVDKDGNFNQPAPPLFFLRAVESAKRLRFSDFDGIISASKGFNVGIIASVPKDLVPQFLDKNNFEKTKAEREKALLEIEKQTNALYSTIMQYQISVLALSGIWEEKETEKAEPFYKTLERIFFCINDGNLTTEAFIGLFFKWCKDFRQSSVLVKPAKDTVFNEQTLEAEIGYIINDSGEISRLGKIGKASIEDWFPFSFRITEINFSDACGLPSPTTSMTRYLNAKKLNDQYR